MDLEIYLFVANCNFWMGIILQNWKETPSAKNIIECLTIAESTMQIEKCPVQEKNTTSEIQKREVIMFRGITQYNNLPF